jgi:hypothetical protein
MIDVDWYLGWVFNLGERLGNLKLVFPGNTSLFQKTPSEALKLIICISKWNAKSAVTNTPQN